MSMQKVEMILNRGDVVATATNLTSEIFYTDYRTIVHVHTLNCSVRLSAKGVLTPHWDSTL